MIYLTNQSEYCSKNNKLIIDINHNIIIINNIHCEIDLFMYQIKHSIRIALKVTKTKMTRL